MQAPIHFSAKNGNLKITDLLLNRGADANLQDNLGRTPLHLSVINNHHLVAVKLILLGSKIEIQDNNFLSALHYSANVRILKKKKKKI